MELDLKQIGRNIRYHRKRRKMSQQDLAKICQISLRTMVSVESGNADPAIDLLGKIGIALEINPITLLQDED